MGCLNFASSHFPLRRACWVFKNRLLFIALPLLVCGSPALTAEQLRDPTRPLREAVSAPSRTETFELNTILMSQSRSVAIINGQTVAAGDTVGTARVLSITPESVALLYRGKPLELRLHSSSVRSNAAGQGLTAKYE